MASEWFYSRNGQKNGPCSSQQLRAMAKSGELLRTDLIWKEGMAKWQPAGDAKQLFEETPKSTVVVPAGSQLPVATLAKGFKEATQTAAQTAQLAAERTKISTVMLPAAYLRLGQHVYATRACESDFPDVFASLDRIAQTIATANATSGNTQTATFGERAKGIAAMGLAFANKKKAEMEQAALFTRLGQSAFAKHRIHAGLGELVTPIQSALDRTAVIDQQLMTYKAALRATKTSKKTVLLGLAATAAVLLVGIVGYGLFRSGREPNGGAPTRDKPPRLAAKQDRVRSTQETPDISALMNATAASVTASADHGKADEPTDKAPSSKESAPSASVAKSKSQADRKQKASRDLSKWRGTQEKDVPHEYLSGPNGEMIEDLYEVKVEPHGKFVNLIRGYISGQVIPPEEAIWQGKRQPILEAARRDGTFIAHGQRIAWTEENAPPIPDRHAQAIAFAANEPPPEPPVVPDKRRLVDYWLEGKCTGVFREFHPDGTLQAQVTYVDGNREGLLVAYWPNGQKKLEEQWVNAKRMGSQKGWHENGQQAIQCEFVDGKPDGTTVWWYANGQKKAEQTERGGKKEGLWQYWYEDGTLKSVNNYANGLDEGEACVYWPNGKLKIRLVYKKGKVVESKGWDSEGKEFEQPAKEPLPKSQYEWGVRYGKKLAIGLNQYIEKLGWEKNPSLCEKAYQDIAESSVLDAERAIREYGNEHSKGVLRGFSEHYKYNAK